MSDVRAEIRREVKSLTATSDGGRVWISEVWERVDAPLPVLQRTLREMLDEEQVVLLGVDFPPELTRGHRASAFVDVSGVKRYLIYWTGRHDCEVPHRLGQCADCYDGE